MEFMDQTSAVRREQRAYRRMPVKLAASLELAFEQQNARLLNLSRGGALVETSKQPNAGSSVILNCGALRTRAKIVWTAGEKIGVRFLDPIPETAVEEQTRRSAAAATARQNFKGS